MGSMVSMSGMPELSHPETMPEAALDEAPMVASDASAMPLRAAEPDALVQGIAAVFADLHLSDRHAAPAAPDEAAHAALDEEITFALLGELNRLWQSDLGGGQR